MTAAPLLELVRDPLPAPAGRANVRRPRLVAELAGPGAPALSVLIAPAGFGKTTLLREWSARDPRPFALGDADVRPRRPAARSCGRSPRRSTPRCATPRDGRVVLVLDDVHVASSAPPRTRRSPPSSTACRRGRRSRSPHAPSRRCRVARLRAEGLVTELRHGDLAMTRSEAAALLRGAGLQLGRDDVDALVRATEGWPAALSLAARSLGDQPVAGRRRPRASVAATGSSRSTCARRSSPRSPRTSARSSRAPRSSTCSPRRSATRCSSAPARPPCSPRSRAPASRSWRSTARASATAITACSATCCAPSCAARSRSSRRELHRRASAWHAARRRPRPRRPARARRGRARARRRPGVGGLPHSSSRARAPRSSTS